MTKKQFEEIGLDIDELTGNAAIEWLNENTTVDTTDITKMSASAKLFIKKFASITDLPVGITSESIEGLSQSFDNSDKSAMIWQVAEELLSPYLKSRVRFVSAKRTW